MKQKNNLEEKEQGYNFQEISRFQFPQVELKEKKLLVNGLEVEGLPEVDGFYINPNGESIAAYKMPTYKDRAEKEEAELRSKDGYRSGVFPGHALYILGYEGENRTKMILKSSEEDAEINERTSQKTKHLIGTKNYLDAEKNRQQLKIIDGVSYENLRNTGDTDGSYENFLQAHGENNSYFINLNNPTEYVTFKETRDEHEKGEAPKINEIRWESLKNKKIYSGGFCVKIDFPNKKIMFAAWDGKEFIVNNREWNFKAKEWANYGVENGIAYAMTRDTLVLDDKKWNENPIKSEREEGKEAISNLKHVSIGGEKGKIAVANECYLGSKWTNEIIEGDLKGPNKVWKNKIKIEKMIAGENTVVAIGNDQDNHLTLVINDVLVKMKDDIAEIIDLKVKEDTVIFIYKTAMGEVVNTEYKLFENAEEQEQLRIEQEKQNEALHQLTNMIFEQGLDARTFLERYTKNETENIELREKSKNYSEEKNRVNISLEQQKILLLQEQNKTADLSRELEMVESYLKKIQPKLEGLKTGFGSSFKISPEDLEAIKENLKRALTSSQNK